jgi:acyl carrier protein
MEIDRRITEIFRDIFENDALELAPSTSAEDVEGWDSIAHISLIFALEEEFGVQFSSRELESMRNVGDLQTIVSARGR